MRRSLLLALAVSCAVAALPSLASAGQWGYPPMGGWAFAPPESHLRFQITPKDAEIYVDGYYAGRVDEFDGTFQRLHVPPGQHEIVIYLEGYRSLRQHVYLSINITRTIAGELARLEPGAPNEARPEPPPQAVGSEEAEPAQPPPPSARPRPGRPPVAPPPPPEARTTSERPTLATLLIQVHPIRSSVTVDGQAWDGPGRNERLIVQVAEGHHRIEVSRNRYETKTIEIDVKAGDTHPITVTLERR